MVALVMFELLPPVAAPVAVVPILIVEQLRAIPLRHWTLRMQRANTVPSGDSRNP